MPDLDPRLEITPAVRDLLHTFLSNPKVFSIRIERIDPAAPSINAVEVGILVGWNFSFWTGSALVDALSAAKEGLQEALRG
jgi:hypothetical protein